MDDLDVYLDTCYGGLEGYVYCAGKGNDGFWMQEFFEWPENNQRIKDWCISASQFCDVYIAPSIFTRPSSKKEYVKGSQVVWVEFDGNAHLRDDLPRPSLVIQSSLPQHQHIYWRVPFSKPEVIEQVNRRLTYALEADSSGWDINQVLRPPMTRNHKRSANVDIIQWPHSQIPTGLNAFDVLPELPPPVLVLAAEKIPKPEDVYKMHNFPMKIYQLLTVMDLPTGERSSYLMYLGYSLAECGLSHPEILSLLVDADDKVGKFKNRHDRFLRLSEIASIAIQKYGEASKIAAYDLLDFIELDIPFIGLWGDLLPQSGNLIFAGEPGVGKTQFALQAAIELLLGSTEFLGIPINQEYPVKKLLFVEMDMPEQGLQKVIIKQLKAFSGVEKLKGKMIIAPHGMHAGSEDLTRLIAEHRPDGVFFDSLSRLSPDSVAGEEEAKKIMDWDSRIRKHFGCFTWFIHHNRKANENNKKPSKLSDVFGSFIYGANFETVLTLVDLNPGQEKAKRALTLYQNKVRYGEQGDALKIHRTEHLTFELGHAAPGQPEINSTQLKFKTKKDK